LALAQRKINESRNTNGFPITQVSGVAVVIELHRQVIDETHFLCLWEAETIHFRAVTGEISRNVVKTSCKRNFSGKIFA